MPRGKPPPLLPEQVLDPTAAAGGQFAALYASHFSAISASQPSPASVGLTAGLAALDHLLQQATSDDTEPARAAPARATAPAAVPPPPLAPPVDVAAAAGPPSPDAAGSALLARLRACLGAPLLPDEAAGLAGALEATPALALSGGVAPQHMPALVAANPAVAVALVACVAAAGPRPMLAAYLEHLLPEAPVALFSGGGDGSAADDRCAQEDCGGGGEGGGGARCALTLRNLEVAHALLRRRVADDGSGSCGTFLIPRSFLGAHLTAAITCVAGAAAGPARAGDPPGQRARLARLVSLYIHALLNDGLLRAEDEDSSPSEAVQGGAAASSPPQPSLLLLECASFALAHAGVAHDAALLFKEIMGRLPVSKLLA
jgi:hypothetical protein